MATDYAGLQIGMRENKLIEVHEEWLVQRGDRWWVVPSPGRTRIKGVPNSVPLNTLALESLRGDVPRIGGRFFGQWKDGNSFKHRWDGTYEREGVHDLHFHDLRHTFASWLMQAGGDYMVIEKLLGHRYREQGICIYTTGTDASGMPYSSPSLLLQLVHFCFFCR